MKRALVISISVFLFGCGGTYEYRDHDRSLKIDVEPHPADHHSESGEPDGEPGDVLENQPPRAPDDRRDAPRGV